MEGVFWSKIWGSVSFSAWKYASFLTWKPGLMVISQQTCFCYSLAMSWLAFFLCSSHGNKDFWSAKQNTVYGGRGYTFSLLQKKSWSMKGDQASCCPPVPSLPLTIFVLPIRLPVNINSYLTGIQLLVLIFDIGEEMVENLWRLTVVISMVNVSSFRWSLDKRGHFICI